MNFIVTLEAFILGMIIFVIDFVVSRKGKDDDFEYNSYSSKAEALSNGREGLVILSFYLLISVFLFFFFKAEPIRSIAFGGRNTFDSPIIVDIIRNISRVRRILLSFLIGLYGIRRKRPEGFIFIGVLLAMPFLGHSFWILNILRFASALLRISIFRTNILMIIYIIYNSLTLTLLIFGNMYGINNLFYRFISLPVFNSIYINTYWIMIIAIIIEIIKIANIKDKKEL